MAVYVDDMRASLKVGNRTYVMCHMIADDEDELRAMAAAIGVQLRYHQYQGTYKSHFDIALTKRALAVKRGALEITAQQVASMVRRRQVTGSLGSPDDAIEWRLQYRYAIKTSEQEESAAN
ncbi:DUF4031 domain-containing protein [Pseudomonas aeruginosa]